MKAIIYIESEEQKQGEDLLAIFKTLIAGLPLVKSELAVLQPTAKQEFQQSKLVDIEPALKARLTGIKLLVDKCTYCGSEFTPKTKRSKFCSEKCGANYWYHKNRKQVSDSRKTGPQVKVCLCCGIEFTKGKLNQKYCSKECRVKDNNRKPVIPRAETRACEVCNTQFKPKRAHSKYCSHNCENRAWRNKMDGYPVNYMGNARSKKPRAPESDQNSTPQKKIAHVKISDSTEHDMKRAKAIKASPDISKQVPVRIDAKTVIYIDPSRDPEEARANYLLRHKM